MTSLSVEMLVARVPTTYEFEPSEATKCSVLTTFKDNIQTRNAVMWSCQIVYEARCGPMQ